MNIEGGTNGTGGGRIREPEGLIVERPALTKGLVDWSLKEACRASELKGFRRGILNYGKSDLTGDKEPISFMMALLLKSKT